MSNSVLKQERGCALVWWKVTTTGRHQNPPDNATAQSRFSYAPISGARGILSNPAYNQQRFTKGRVPWWGLLENKVASLAGRSFTMTGTVDAGAYVATTTVTFPPPDLVMPTSLRLVMFGSYSSGYRYKPEVRGTSPEPGFVSLRGAYTIFFEVPEPGTLSLVVCAAGVVFGSQRRRATAYPPVQALPEF